MEFRILGPLEVADGDGPITIAAGKQRALLALLLLNANRVVPAGRLVDLMWGEEIPDTATKSLQVHVSKLRKQLGPDRIQTRGSGYVLEVGAGELDLDEFEDLSRRGAAALGVGDPEEASSLLEAALERWRGHALAELDAPFAPLEAARLEELRLGCLEQRIEADLALGRDAELVSELESLVAAHPLRERLRSQQMLALYRSGRQAEALAAYQRFRRLLDEEIGIEPTPALRELERLMLQQDPSLDPARSGRQPAVDAPVAAPPRTRPARRRPVGRDTELAVLAGLVDEATAGNRRVAFVRGEAGVGKTTLLDAALEDASARATFRTGRGQCVEHRGAGEPYLPVFDALGRLGRAEAGSIVVDSLRRFAPTWLTQLPSLVADDEREWIKQRASGVTHERMLRELVEALDHIATSVPLVLVLEDLHWSDPSTLTLIDTIARRPDPASLLLVASTRIGDEGAAVRGLVQGLRLRGLCTDIPVEPLAPAAVREYLDVRMPGNGLPDDLADDVATRTRGVPLFVEKLVDSWLETGAVAADDGTWSPRVPVEELRDSVPATVRELIQETFRPLDEETRALLEAASVVGIEFAAALVAAGSERDEEAVDARLAELAEHGTLVEPRGEAVWPDGTVTTVFAFTHDLLQETLYDTTPAARRARTHERVGARLESGWGERAPEVATALAWHFANAGDAERGARRLLEAAERAFRKMAPREARTLVGTAFGLLERIPDEELRKRLELSAHLIDGAARIPIEGWASEQVDASLERAAELARSVGDVASLGKALFNHAAVYEIRGEYERSEHVIAEALALPEDALGLELLVDSTELMACTLVHQGRHAEALSNADRALEIAGGALLPQPVAVFGESPGVSAHVWASLALWHLGRPETAIMRAEQAVAAAAIAARAFARGMASVNAAIVNQCVGRPEPTRQWAEAAMDSSTLAGFPYWGATASILRGWARAATGNAAEGASELRDGLAATRATGARLDDPYFLTLLADVSLRLGDLDGGLSAVDEALETTSGKRSFFCEPELHRLRGELLLVGGDEDAAFDAFTRAADIARDQGALSYQLRAALSLARTRPNEATVLRLATTLGAFTEGHALRDLVEARALLEEHGVEVPAHATAEPVAVAPPPPRPTTAPTLYASSDGLSIAYQVTGAGATDLLLVPGFVSHLEKDWDEPRHASFLDRLGSFSRLIRFDKRGTGLSDRTDDVPDLETRMGDLTAVMDAAGSERAVVFGYSEGGPLGILLAASHPERVAALVLFGVFAKRVDPDDDYPWALTERDRAAYIDGVATEWGLETHMKVMCPSADDALARWWGERSRAAASPGALRRLMEMNSKIDVRSALASVHVPTLVVHRGTDFTVHVEEGRYIASRIQGSRIVELPGADHFPAVDSDQILDVVEPFVREIAGDAPGLRRLPPDGDRVLATLMFTDIVGSTDTAARLGDAAWSALLDRHNAIVRDELARHAGAEVDAAGDGFFAVFDGPARAVRCGRSIVERLASLGLDVRVGVHTGEVERTNGAYRGIAVHTASRVASVAAPREVLVSSTTRDLVSGSELGFQDRGEHVLRGVDGPRRLYAVA